MTPQEQQAIDAALAVVQTVGPALGAGGALASAVITAAAAAITSAETAGTDVTDAQLGAVFDQFEANHLDDLVAERAARAAGDTTGDAIQPT